MKLVHDQHQQLFWRLGMLGYKLGVHEQLGLKLALNGGGWNACGFLDIKESQESAHGIGATWETIQNSVGEIHFFTFGSCLVNRGGTNSDRLDLPLMDASEGVLERSHMVSVHLVKIAKVLNASGQMTPWES